MVIPLLANQDLTPMLANKNQEAKFELLATLVQLLFYLLADLPLCHKIVKRHKE